MVWCATKPIDVQVNQPGCKRWKLGLAKHLQKAWTWFCRACVKRRIPCTRLNISSKQDHFYSKCFSKALFSRKTLENSSHNFILSSLLSHFPIPTKNVFLVLVMALFQTAEWQSKTVIKHHKTTTYSHGKSFILYVHKWLPPVLVIFYCYLLLLVDM